MWVVVEVMNLLVKLVGYSRFWRYRGIAFGLTMQNVKLAIIGGWQLDANTYSNYIQQRGPLHGCVELDMICYALLPCLDAWTSCSAYLFDLLMNFVVFRRWGVDKMSRMAHCIRLQVIFMEYDKSPPKWNMFSYQIMNAKTF